MKYLLVVLAVFLLAAPAHATRLVSDNSTESPQTCEFNGISILCLLNAHGGIDTPVTVSALGVGAKTIRARYCVQDGLWCSEWSSPLSVSVPALSQPGTVRLSK